MFAAREERDGIGWAVTDRHGGVSSGPFAELNLGDHVGDDPAAVAGNRRRLLAALGPGLRLAGMRQVHGDRVAVVDAEAAEEDADPPEADALVTTSRGVVLTVLVADCVPVLLADAQAGVVAAAHVGRRGLAAGIVRPTVAAMVDAGARPGHIRVHVGPAVCPRHYEVPAELRDEVVAAAPGSAARTGDGRPAIDIRAGLVHQLRACGLPDPAVSAECTAESDRLFSYRRDRTTGRFAGLVWLAP